MPGLIEDARYSEQTLSASHGRIVLYTDGLFEAASTANLRQALTDIVKQTLVDTLEQSPAEAANTCMQAFDRHAGVPPDDDAMLILIEAS